MSELRSIVDRTYEAFNARDFDAYRDLLDEDVELVMSGSAVRGLVAVTEFVALTARARPGLRIEPQRVFVETGDTLVTEVRMIDTATTGLTDEAATIETSACGLYRVKGGRIVAWRVYLDPPAEDMASAALVAVTAEQSALRRVAEQVARQATPEQVFAAVVEELGRLFGVEHAGMVRYEAEGAATIVAAWAEGDREVDRPVGTRLTLGGENILTRVLQTSRPSRVDDYAHATGPIAVLARERGTGPRVGAPIVVEGRVWGAMIVGGRNEPLPSGTEDRVMEFAELVSTAISNVESRGKVERLAAEQSALRRVAELVARQAAPEEVFDLVTEELSRLLDVVLVRMVRFESDGTATILATRIAGEDRIPPGTNVPLPGGTVIDEVFRTGGPARVDNYGQVPGPIGASLRAEGPRCGAGGPIVVDARVWGAMVVGGRSAEALPPGSEDRVTEFAELVSAAISNIESRAKVERLAAEQSALRRVATLVAREHSPDDLFAMLAEEIGVLLEVDASGILRYEADSTVTAVAGWSKGAITMPLGVRLPLAGENLAAEVQRTGKPERKDDYGDSAGTIAASMAERGIRSAVANPIVVEGKIWGALGVMSRKPEPLPLDTEARLAEFSRHAGIAVANDKSRSDLAESRARIVRAADETRRRFERDLHDGAQQRLVSLGLAVRAAEPTVPPEMSDLRSVLSRLGAGLTDVLDDLRELSQGLHPAVLSEGGLSPALRALARRSAVPVEPHIELEDERFEEPVEVAAYYAASEALANTAKHARASRAEVTVSKHDTWLEVTVSDDGRGGADASGSGLTGLVDRVEAIGGTIRIDSAAGAGTSIHVKLPARSTS